MPSLKELRAELKKSMKPIGKMSRDEVVLMLEKHKPDNVVIPKTKMVAEHKELVDVLEKPTPKKLKKEAEKQEKELKVMKVKVPMVKYDSSDEEAKPVAVKSVAKKVLSSKPPVEKKEKKTEDSDKRKQWAELRRNGKSSAEAWAIIKGQ